ncbi:MAG: hypothetical protein KIT84_37130 [Labilithrix sp.]|nr:hypothetical protein [Labilithrix sp.]MCW5816682.1 hypothetical protein [Labilithrix sp.]
MRRHLLLLIPVFVAGCAEDEVMRPAAAPSSPAVWSNTEAAPALPEPPPPPPRPRLSQTITLGQDDYSPRPPPAPAAQGQGTSNNVTVNNNIVVQSPPVFYGGGFGYGYGGYGAARSGDGRTGVGVAPRTPWAPSGWEGAQRTAAPGQTPGVGGNWAPPPSHGPAPMR